MDESTVALSENDLTSKEKLGSSGSSEPVVLIDPKEDRETANPLVESEKGSWKDEDYYPTLAEAEENPDAQALVNLAQELNVDVGELIKLYEYKRFQLSQLELEPEVDVVDIETPDISRLQLLADISRNDNALDVATAHQVELASVSKNMGLTTIKGKLMRRFGRGKEVLRANSSVREEAAREINGSVIRLAESIKRLREELPRVSDSARRFVWATDLEEAKVQGDLLQGDSNTVVDLQSRLDGYKEVVQQLSEIEGVETILRAVRSESEIEYLQKQINLAKERLSETKDGANLRGWFADSLLKRRVAFQEACEALDPDNRGGCVTREFYDAQDVFNQHIERFVREHGDEWFSVEGAAFNKLHTSRFQMTEGKEISQGRLLTHVARDSAMFDILREGLLSSAAAMEARGKDSWEARTFTQANDGSAETHEVCFALNACYTEIAADRKNAPDANIAIVLAENQLLAEGGQFVEHDGIHVYDPDFNSEDQNSPGFEVDLQRTPFMLLVNSRIRDKATTFLMEESAWSDTISNLTPDERDAWFADNVRFVDDLSTWHADKDMVDNFYSKKGIDRVRGRVHLTNNYPEMKVGRVPTYRFQAAA